MIVEVMMIIIDSSVNNFFFIVSALEVISEPVYIYVHVSERISFVCACECVRACVCSTRVQSMCRNVNVFFLCCRSRQTSVTVHIY